ncbi:YwqI/YxiC family protein [Paucisalibacillus globulus]|jgi:hypothetical protein|uniref:YwqI/YxiC family protein n=1 Tax=Paucisalibacillus globulus TaxID=351095 RepID=UPI000412E575|nr:YwqI/YxiC family protein [Paucisalibacillus globulus]
MSGEIKLVDGPIKQGISQLNGSTRALVTSFYSFQKGDNTLDMVDSLLEINQSFEDVLITYREIMVKHAGMTEEAIVSLQETEKLVASGIRLIK